MVNAVCPGFTDTPIIRRLFIIAWKNFAFAIQGLGTVTIGLAGSSKLKAQIVQTACSGGWISAFALSEKDPSSDVAAMACAARRDGDDHVLDCENL